MRPLSSLLVAAALCLAVAVVGCGRKGKPAAHAAEPASAIAPTPDTTPVDALRTPAGLVLKTDQTPAPATPSPAAASAKAP